MKPGDLVQPVGDVPVGMNHTQTLPRDRYIHLGEKLPWDEHQGIFGETHPFPHGTTGIYLSKEAVYKYHKYESGHNVFYKILTSDGRIGWLHESWVRKIQ